MTSQNEKMMALCKYLDDLTKIKWKYIIYGNIVGFYSTEPYFLLLEDDTIYRVFYDDIFQITDPLFTQIYKSLAGSLEGTAPDC